MYYDSMFEEKLIGSSNPTPSVFAYIPELDEVIKYDECIDLKDKDKWHEDCCRRKNFVGIGYIMGYNNQGQLYSFDELSMFYVDK